MKILKVICVAILSLFISSAVFSAETKRTANVISFTGQPSLKSAGQNDWTSVAKGMVINEGDTLKTGKDASARVNVDSKGEAAIVDVSPGSNLTFTQLLKNTENGTEKTMLDLALGEVLIKAEKLRGDSKFEVKTPTSVAGVRGTKFSVKVEAIE
ncbi:MAG: FecR family protein [Candidatus Omnitrophota bacterium]|nr:FecR family protein [Candidatus Omnitrophota bacterium]